MRFLAHIASVGVIFGFLSHTIASPDTIFQGPPSHVERDLATVTEVLSDVSSGIESLDSAVQSFSGDAGPVQDAAESLVSTINNGKSQVDDSDNLTLGDALGLQDPVQALTEKAQTLTNDLKAQKSAIEAAGLCSTTRSQISSINDASQGLIDSIISKVPEAAQSIAKELASGLTDVLNDAQDAFSESNCVDSDGSSISGPAPTTTSPETSTTEAVIVSSTANTLTTSVLGSTVIPSTSSVPLVTTNVTETYPPLIPSTTPEPTTIAPTPPVVTAGAAVVAPVGALLLGIAAVLV
ncbi:cell wall protein [Dactylonectria macrodidyma]|uniref:Cell wall protein n=1 Tax=Dactylonectria macrodidyma TaxID=307937 RepID=A0A9P9FTQ7_9HYPO|nr:cell wall protein [Dactylonectria macrodidyma]